LKPGYLPARSGWWSWFRRWRPQQKAGEGGAGEGQLVGPILDSKLVGGDRRVRLRKGKESRIFFWRTYIAVRRDVEKRCATDLIAHEPDAYLSYGELMAAGAAFLPDEVWRGTDHWSARCEGGQVVTEVQLRNDDGRGETPVVVYSLMQVEQGQPTPEKQDGP
jgi:hypothetical protein